MLVLALLVLTVILLTLSLLLRSHDDDIGRLATGWSAAMATDDAGLFDDSGRSDDAGLFDNSGRSDDARRSDDTGFSLAADEGRGFVSMGETSGLTDNWTGSDGGLDVGRGGVLFTSAFCLAADPTQYQPKVSKYGLAFHSTHET